MITIVAAHDKNRVIGNDGQMPWHLPTELKRFKELTTGHAVIMGRKTFDSIGKPLPNRLNIVVSKSIEPSESPNLFFVNSLDKALKAANGHGKIFVIGGGQIYQQALDIADELILTEIDAEFAGDAYFPQFSQEQWEIIKRTSIFNDAYPYSTTTYIKKAN